MSHNVKEVDALVVGGGFGGIRLVNLLQNKLGFKNVVAVEKGSALGGTWYWNQYPGAQTDTESWVYRFSDDRDPPKWNTRYLQAKDLQEQILDTAKKTDVFRDYIFDNEVVSAHYNAASNRWDIATDKGLHFSATYFLTALGILTNPNIPKIPGIDSFKGLSFHSARWPKDLDVTGKRVAVIGTGPSGSQITAAIHHLVKQITVFQQRAQYIVPINDRPVSDEEKKEIYKTYDGIWNTVFNSLFAMGFVESNKSALEATEAERQEVYERIWNKGGGFRFFFETFNDIATNIEANETAAAFVRSKIAQIVKDPKVTKLLQPKGPYGGRPLCTQGYYESFNEPNVSLVDISENTIAKITPTGLELKDGQAFEFDIIVYATGFDGVDGAYHNIDIVGRNGLKLTEAWKDGANALYGVSVAEFPNFYTVTGPGGPFANMLPSIELQGNFIIQLIEEANKRGSKTVEADAEAQAKWDEKVQAISKATVFDKVKSWIQNDNVDGKQKRSAFFLAGLQNYRATLGEEADAKYPSFVFAK
ncbi:Baeyer-Villiger monooxygenase [Hypsizygus marmoreus]|uniref:Baeyer-Villiger monooxygenase n=1 Tax=Hypsizygus marmoreus TaxID=39966 RepID=A0A369J6C0_HYPMA|nr:Baeyer-Villiger monooxygenase [Hypsizygus marmoreus]